MTVDVSDLVGIGLSQQEIENEIKRRQQENKPKFEPYRFQFVINPYRKVFGVQKPIRCSRYAKELFKIGAGWK